MPKFKFGSLVKEEKKDKINQTSIIPEIEQEFEIGEPIEIEEVKPRVKFFCQHCGKDYVNETAHKNHEFDCKLNPKNQKPDISEIIIEKFEVFENKFEILNDKLDKIIESRPINTIERRTLTEENVLQYFQDHKFGKPHKLREFFEPSPDYDVSDIMHDLKDKGFLNINKNGWYYLKRKFKKEVK